MHEVSLVRNIFRTLETEFSEAERRHITTINLKIGLLSNVEPVLLQNAFEAVIATENPEYQRTKLNTEIIPIEIYCAECNQRTRVENYRFVCHCGKPNNNIVQGMELLISGVEFEMDNI